ncbi:tryptophan-rich sensory protein [Granulosicoccus sp.]|nr:tryptophan-rich sensory protein [Granulosicoccus sp.]
MWVSYAVTTAALFVVGGIGGRATEIGPWYRNLNKPAWNPPDWAFPVVWTSIYILIIISVGGAWNQASPGEKTMILWLVGINLILNMLWSILFFAMRKPLWALFENFLLWLSIIAMMTGLYSIAPLYGWLTVPYLIWVSIAMLLNLSIVRLNPELSAA